MGEEHSSALTFNLEESVWLNQGEKIKELLSLGLEPDIRIEEKYDYVDIKGGLYLKGEYYPVPQEEKEEETQQPVPQYVEKHSLREDGVGELQHFFPVDVTVPLNRISNLDDIYVNIDSFDYDLPEPGCIQLTADVSITGVNELEREQDQEPLEETTVQEAMPRWEMEETYQPDVDPPADNVDEAGEEMETEEVREELPTEEAQVENTEEAGEENTGETAEVVTAFHSREPEEPEEPKSGEIEEAPAEADAENKVEPESSGRDDNALYLTKMMTSGDEDFSRLKMCIIQENESLDTIAERYDTTIGHLLRFNRLDQDHVEEGQILYIPGGVSQKNNEDR
ncbi:stage VI sporulation protein D [Salibacterium aidingense]|uniref:stage VI sporulation protein D n=1 Tax=Salibacterium aidingense TaxID=384933 RepID=UPI0003FD9B0C|nr:stage VI sporulation protein D [Salibacterium aidingense]